MDQNEPSTSPVEPKRGRKINRDGIDPKDKRDRRREKRAAEFGPSKLVIRTMDDGSVGLECGHVVGAVPLHPSYPRPGTPATLYRRCASCRDGIPVAVPETRQQEHDRCLARAKELDQEGSEFEAAAYRDQARVARQNARTFGETWVDRVGEE